MYLSNKYSRWYYNIVNNALSRTTLIGYSEKHHIIPKSLGGNDKKENLARLTAREHFICHWLLTRMVEGEHLIKMKRALWRMLVKGADFQQRYRPNSHVYEKLRLQYGSLRKGTITPEDVKKKISNANKGKPAWNKGIPRTLEEKRLMSASRKAVANKVGVWNLGIPHSAETIKKLTEKAKLRKKYTCLHCDKEVAGSNYFRWHSDNCRLKVQ